MNTITPYSATDMPMIHKILKGGPVYNISEGIRADIIRSAHAIMRDSEVSEEKLRAAKVLLLADRLNVQVASLMVPRKVEHINVNELSDQDLRDAVNQTLKLMPRVIDPVESTSNDIS